jgi:hypothetical protein
MYVRKGMGQTGYDTNTGIVLDTSALTISDPTGNQIDAALIAMERSACNETPGSIWNPSDNSCTGSGGSSACPTGFVASGSACVAAPVSSLPTWLLPVGIALIAGLVLLGGRR